MAPDVAAMPINFFDLLLVAVLAAGLIRGRKHGISAEFLRLLKWLVLLFGCAVVYQPLGGIVSGLGFFDALSAFLLAYLGVALAIFLIFSLVERRLTPRLAGGDTFGRGEYYLGMGSGLVRYACILMVLLALLNAREFTPAEVQASRKAQMDSYGTIIFPTLRGVQSAVFEQSLSGSCIKNHLAFLLIAPTEANQPVRTAEAHSTSAASSKR